MKPGTEIRLLHDASRVGIATGRTRNGHVKYYQIQFPTGKQWVPEDQLESVSDDSDAFTLFEDGRFGGAQDLYDRITHVRISGRLADYLYSLEATNTEFHAFQYKPILKILNSPTRGLLIADEVGLGKTIEAGLIWTELRARYSFSRLLVLCPAMLREKWVRELKNRFGVDAEVKGTDEVLSTLKETSNRPGDSSFAIVASQQGLRPSKGSRASLDLHEFLKEHEYEDNLLDLLVVDEAHYMKNPNSKTHKLGRALVNCTDHSVFLSATPIHLGRLDLYNLLKLLDESTFSQETAFDEILRANAPLLQTRDALLRGDISSAERVIECLREAREHELLRDSQQIDLLIKEAEQISGNLDTKTRSHFAYAVDGINLLSNVVTRTRKRDVNELRVVRNPVPEVVPMTETEARFYEEVTNLVRDYCEGNEVMQKLLLTIPQRQVSSSMPAALEAWRSNQFVMEDMEEGDYYDLHEGRNEDEIGPLTATLSALAGRTVDLEELRENDSKFNRLREVLHELEQKHPGEKIVLFAYYRATLAYLSRRLQQEGFDTMILWGGMDDKDERLERFERPEGPQILLSSEVASEGVDLQFSRFLINYDLPWNPMKIEQRIGRIDRIGQEAERITIWNLAYRDTIDERILDRLYNRLDVFQHALGDLDAILGSEIRKLTIELLTEKITPEQEEARINQTAVAIENRRKEEERLEKEAAHLLAHGDYILKKIRSTRQEERWVTPEDIQNYLFGFLDSEYPGCSYDPMPDSEDAYLLELASECKNTLSEFIRDTSSRFNTRLTRSAGKVPCLITNKVYGSRDKECVNHMHPLVRMACVHGDEKYARLASAVAVQVQRDQLSMDIEPGVYYFMLQLWSFKGLRRQDEIKYLLADNDGAIVDINEVGNLIREFSSAGQSWINAGSQLELSDGADVLFECKQTLDQSFARETERRRAINRDMANVRRQGWQNFRELKIGQHEEIRDRHLERMQTAPDSGTAGRFRGLAQAEQNKIEALEDQVDKAMASIDKQEELTASPLDLGLGVVEVL